jgi:two-component system NtrC family sensor kinase
MKIKRKIMLSDMFNILLILLIGFFAFQNFNVILTKLRFVEIADDLNASFLEMRIAEKNYFLYDNASALMEILEKIRGTKKSIAAVKSEITRAVGKENFEQLQSFLREYEKAVREVQMNSVIDPSLKDKLRAEGQKLRGFSRTATELERTRMNHIIWNSKKILIFSFWAVFFSALIVNHLVSKKILNPLGEIERLAKSISKGVFKKITGVKFKDEFGSVIDAINSMSEELEYREEEIIQSKKLASLGVLTAGVAHELNNPLNNISMIAQTYLENYDQLTGEQRQDFMSKIEDETERIRKIVGNLLDFSKPQETVLEVCNINEVVDNSLKLLQNSINIANIETKTHLRKNLPRVLVDEHQIQQVLVNLIVNALHAMPSKGKLSIETRYRIHADVLEVEIADTGHGIPAEFLPHIFDPFFSTKGVGGTGLGLSVSYGIVRNHGGNIRVESEIGAGTRFVIELPIVRSKKEETNEPA